MNVWTARLIKYDQISVRPKSEKLFNYNVPLYFYPFLGILFFLPLKRKEKKNEVRSIKTILKFRNYISLSERKLSIKQTTEKMCCNFLILISIQIICLIQATFRQVIRFFVPFLSSSSLIFLSTSLNLFQLGNIFYLNLKRNSFLGH